MMIEEYVKKWPKAYKPDQKIYPKNNYELVWYTDAPLPTDEMTRRGAIYLGTGQTNRKGKDFSGWHFTNCRWVYSPIHGGNYVHWHYALDPSAPNADTIIREFRPDLVEDEPEKGIEPFWMVYVEGGRAPTVKHESYQDAEREAVRLAEKEGEPAYILRGVMAVEVAKKVLWKVIS